MFFFFNGAVGDLAVKCLLCVQFSVKKLSNDTITRYLYKSTHAYDVIQQHHLFYPSPLQAFFKLNTTTAINFNSSLGHYILLQMWLARQATTLKRSRCRGYGHPFVLVNSGQRVRPSVVKVILITLKKNSSVIKLCTLSPTTFSSYKRQLHLSDLRIYWRFISFFIIFPRCVILTEQVLMVVDYIFYPD